MALKAAHFITVPNAPASTEMDHLFFSERDNCFYLLDTHGNKSNLTAIVDYKHDIHLPANPSQCELEILYREIAIIRGVV